MLVCFLAIFICSYCNCQVLFPGPCPELKAVENFNLNQFLGKWTEYQRYSLLFEPIEDTKYEFGPIQKNGVVMVKKQFKENGVWKTSKGHLMHNSPKFGYGELLLSLDDIDVLLYVLGTDYENYCVVWSCSNFSKDVTYHESSILGRKTVFDMNDISSIIDTVMSNGLNMANFRSQSTST